MVMLVAVTPGVDAEDEPPPPQDAATRAATASRATPRHDRISRPPRCAFRLPMPSPSVVVLTTLVSSGSPGHGTPRGHRTRPAPATPRGQAPPQPGHPFDQAAREDEHDRDEDPSEDGQG